MERVSCKKQEDLSPGAHLLIDIMRRARNCVKRTIQREWFFVDDTNSASLSLSMVSLAQVGMMASRYTYL